MENNIEIKKSILEKYVEKFIKYIRLNDQYIDKDSIKANYYNKRATLWFDKIEKYEDNVMILKKLMQHELICVRFFVADACLNKKELEKEAYKVLIEIKKNKTSIYSILADLRILNYKKIE